MFVLYVTVLLPVGVIKEDDDWPLRLLVKCRTYRWRRLLNQNITCYIIERTSDVAYV